MLLVQDGKPFVLIAVLVVGNYCNLKNAPPLCGDPQTFMRSSGISNPTARILDNSALGKVNEIAPKLVSKAFAPVP